MTLAGANASVVGGSFGALFVTDNGTSDTITAGGFGFTSVSAATSSAFVQGGAGLLNFVGGTGVSTIMGWVRQRNASRVAVARRRCLVAPAGRYHTATSVTAMYPIPLG